MSNNAVERRSTAPTHPPFSNGESSENDADYETLQNDFFHWLYSDDCVPKQPHPNATMNGSETSMNHVDLIRNMFREMYGTESDILPVNDIERLFEISLKYWIYRLEGEKEDFGWSHLEDEMIAEFLDTEDQRSNLGDRDQHQGYTNEEIEMLMVPGRVQHILLSCGFREFERLDFHPQSIFGSERSEYPVPEIALVELLISSQSSMNENFFSAASPLTRSIVAKKYVMRYADKYEITNQFEGLTENDISPEQELILQAAALPLLFLLERRFKNIPDNIFEQKPIPIAVQRAAYEAGYHWSKAMQLNSPDFSLRLNDAGFAFQFPHMYFQHFDTIIRGLFTIQSIQSLDYQEIMGTPPYIFRDLLLQKINKNIRRGEMLPDDILSLKSYGSDGAPVGVQLRLDSARPIADASKLNRIQSDPRFISFDGSPDKQTDIEELTSMTEALAMSVLLGEDSVPSAVGSDEVGPISGLDAVVSKRLGRRNISINGVEYTLSDDLTLKEFISLYRFPGRDRIGWRFALLGFEELDTAVGINMLPDLIDRFEDLGFKIIGVSSLYGNKLWEAMHLVAKLDWKEVGSSERVIHLPNNLGPLEIRDGVLLEIQIATEAVLDQNFHTSAERKRLGHHEVVIVAPEGIPNPQVSDMQLSRFYFQVGEGEGRNNYADALGRAIGRAISRGSGIVQGMDNDFFAQLLLKTAYKRYEEGVIDMDRKGQQVLYLQDHSPLSTLEALEMCHVFMNITRDPSGREGFVNFIRQRIASKEEEYIKQLSRSDFVPASKEVREFILANATTQEFALFPPPPIKSAKVAYLERESLPKALRYKTFLDLTLFVIGELGQDIDQESLHYDDIEPDLSTFVFQKNLMPQMLINNLVFEGHISLEELFMYMDIALQLYNSEHPDTIYQSGSVRPKKPSRSMLMDGYLRTPTNLMAKSHRMVRDEVFQLRKDIRNILSLLIEE